LFLSAVFLTFWEKGYKETSTLCGAAVIT
jgi:hypothetical protein